MNVVRQKSDVFSQIYLWSKNCVMATIALFASTITHNAIIILIWNGVPSPLTHFIFDIEKLTRGFANSAQNIPFCHRGRQRTNCQNSKIKQLCQIRKKKVLL